LIRLRPDASRRTRILQQDAFDLVVKKAFGQRRKRLSNALDGVLTAARIESAGIDPGKRAEQLSVEEFISLGNRYVTAQ
jgi:16S rRNA (adenine1518-N6/adenine1519-N6)-dimethyltransferase